MAKAQVIKFR